MQGAGVIIKAMGGYQFKEMGEESVMQPRMSWVCLQTVKWRVPASDKVKQFHFLVLFTGICSNEVMCAETPASQCVFFCWLSMPGWRIPWRPLLRAGGSRVTGQKPQKRILHISSCVCSLGSQQLEMNAQNGSCP